MMLERTEQAHKDSEMSELDRERLRIFGQPDNVNRFEQVGCVRDFEKLSAFDKNVNVTYVSCV